MGAVAAGLVGTGTTAGSRTANGFELVAGIAAAALRSCAIHLETGGARLVSAALERKNAPVPLPVDRIAELREDATHERLLGAERACELVRAAWREAEELQVTTGVALEALLIRLRGELAPAAAPV